MLLQSPALKNAGQLEVPVMQAGFHMLSKQTESRHCVVKWCQVTRGGVRWFEVVWEVVRGGVRWFEVV